MGHISELVWGMDAILVPIGPCCGDLQWSLFIFGDHTLFWFCDAISGDGETCSVGQYKVANCQISLTFHPGIKLSIPLAPSGWVNPILNFIPFHWELKHSQACQTEMSLRVTKYHRAAIFDEAYLRACARYGCDSSSYRTMLQRPTKNSLTFWRSYSILILWCHLRSCWNL